MYSWELVLWIIVSREARCSAVSLSNATTYKYKYIWVGTIRTVFHDIFMRNNSLSFLLSLQGHITTLSQFVICFLQRLRIGPAKLVQQNTIHKVP